MNAQQFIPWVYPTANMRVMNAWGSFKPMQDMLSSCYGFAGSLSMLLPQSWLSCIYSRGNLQKLCPLLIVSPEGACVMTAGQADELTGVQ